MIPSSRGPRRQRLAPHLVSKAENGSKLELVAEPGKNVFVWQKVKMGILRARSKLQLVDETAARPRVSQCSLAETAPAPTAVKHGVPST